MCTFKANTIFIGVCSNKLILKVSFFFCLVGAYRFRHSQRFALFTCTGINMSLISTLGVQAVKLFRQCVDFFQAVQKRINACPDVATKESYSVINVTADVSHSLDYICCVLLLVLLCESKTL